MVRKLPITNHANQWEEDISSIAYLHDTTSFVFITAVGLETAGAASTANAIVDLTKWAENTLYIDSTAAVARTANTALTVIFETRPASGIGWTTFRTETAVNESGLSAWNIVGSGVAGVSGVTHFGDVRITIENTTDSSGTATVQAWLKLRTPK